MTGGAALGVALVMLAQPLWAMLPLPQDLLITVAALAGAIAVLFLIVAADRRVGDGITPVSYTHLTLPKEDPG